ncbi:restriction endonuclease [Rhodococcus sp. NPDC057297]|uniref:restriction endonuclease n=1 Tax=Rhodococcus sp. NPDC057297 TaxID=3346090 RepID=UPI00362E8F91
MTPLKLIREEAMSLAVSTLPRKTVHVLSHLSRAFTNHGYSEMQSDELAELWADRFLLLFDEYIDETWSLDEIDPPLYASTMQEHVLLGVRHPRFMGGINEDRLQIINFIRYCDPVEFVWCCAIALAHCGASKVFIVDGPNDGGIDVLGLYRTPAIHAHCVAIQAKAWTGGLSAQHVEDVVNKYHFGLRKPVWEIYDALVDLRTQPGVSKSLIIASRDGFGSSGLTASRSLGSTCWSSYKIGSLVAPGWTYQEFIEMVGILRKQSLARTTNIVPLVSWTVQQEK